MSEMTDSRYVIDHKEAQVSSDDNQTAAASAAPERADVRAWRRTRRAGQQRHADRRRNSPSGA